MTFLVLGPPRTKKNHGRVIKRGRRRFHVPSEAQTAWAESAFVQLRRQHIALVRAGRCDPGQFAIRGPVNCRAFIYRDALRGDAVGYYQAIADALEKAGIVENDRLVVAWDGSRLMLDRQVPRVELELTPLTVALPSVPLTADHSRKMLVK